MLHRVEVVVATPAHGAVGGPLTYSSEEALVPGSLVRVPLGRREVLGIAWTGDGSGAGDAALKPVAAVFDGIAPLSANWQQLVQFAASYYQRSIGEIALAALPPQLRDLDAAQWARRMKRTAERDAGPPVPRTELVLTREQADALARLDGSAHPFLLFGATGSGKTEVYLQSAQRLLEHDPQAQAL